MTRFGINIKGLNWESRKDYPVSGACYVQR